MTSHGLPSALKTAAAQMIAGREADLRQGAAALSCAYKSGAQSAESLDFAAYLAVRLPATFAAVSRAFGELQRHVPDFAPASMCDVGSGPGTASWAAAEIWPDLRRFTFVDNNRAFLALATDLARHHQALAGAEAIRAGMESFDTKADLVAATYALAEVPEQAVAPITARLWRNTTSVLVLVEPGTPAGFARIRRAREALIAAGASIAAPCPHALACPMMGKDWCHFSVRLPRSRLHLRAKGATVPFEDERFSYVIATRLPMVPAVRRVLSPPEVTKAAVTFKLCTTDGIAIETVPRRRAMDYKLARKRQWGDSV